MHLSIRFFFQEETTVYAIHVEIMQNAMTSRVVLSVHVCLGVLVIHIVAVSVRDLKRTCVETNTVE
jgi:hypothetical protein